VCSKDIFNIDKTALFYIAQLNRTQALREEVFQVGKGWKNRVTVLLCCKAGDSGKLCPLIAGNFEKPCCLKGLKHYSCDHKSSKNAWVTGRLFREWLFKENNLPKLGGPFDTRSVYGKGLNLKHVRMLYLLSNTTSYMQPLD
jgi:hypothetical protein